MTTEEFAALIRTTPQAVRMMRHRGIGPKGMRIGRRVLYSDAAVRTWLALKAESDRIAQRADRST